MPIVQMQKSLGFGFIITKASHSLVRLSRRCYGVDQCKFSFGVKPSRIIKGVDP